MRAIAPPAVRVGVSDSLLLMMHPNDVATGPAYRVIQVEPDGQARAMAIYEGTVGNLLEEHPRRS